MKQQIRQLYRYFRAQLLQRVIPKSATVLPNEKDLCIEVIGFFQSISGIGESARLCAQQLAADGYRVKCTSVESFFRKPQEINWQWHDTTAGTEINCRIYHLNPPMLPPVILQMGLSNFKKTYNIGYWAWELETIPAEWIKAIRYMNAIFTPSNFTTKAIKNYTSIPVLTATHPVTRSATSQGIRDRLNIPAQAFLVSNIFSFGSAMERKNPMGLITAFTQAFNATDDAYLVLKANAGSNTPEKQNLLKAIQAYPNIRLVDEHWSREDVLGLIESSDLYASLHRSEGFGLTIAEAMLLDTPTLVTAWSGNMDFCTEENSFLVQFKPIKVESSHPEFQGFENATWADADVQQTTQILKQIYQKRELLLQKKHICAKQMQSCIDTNKYQHALKKLVDGEGSKETNQNWTANPNVAE
ncbi:MAG: glycosyltransferase [Cellvibrio sp.]|uniref:glycosyltransferase n=1 Tax=Cellvibrio sp. TaxID=1965322 RepID=UPI0031A42043